MTEIKQLSPTNGNSLRTKIEQLSQQKIAACYQCEKCTNGCPLTFAMDLMPHQVVHLINLGMIDRVLHSETIWTCATCETCTARCPNGIDLARIMNSLKLLCRQRGIDSNQHGIPVFQSAFLSSIKAHGRIQETELAIKYTVQDSGLVGLTRMAALGFALFLRGKIKLSAKRIRDLKSVRVIFESTKDEIKG